MASTCGPGSVHTWWPFLSWLSLSRLGHAMSLKSADMPPLVPQVERPPASVRPTRDTKRLGLVFVSPLHPQVKFRIALSCTFFAHNNCLGLTWVASPLKRVAADGCVLQCVCVRAHLSPYIFKPFVLAKYIQSTYECHIQCPLPRTGKKKPI
ncbi:hypothetical protein H696_00274 [Fonticula alba]|uniref:Secreted protein n=1 Tax=Fonticula alba TaxID=691883 RepID=A0A058ZE67_FONAL|nr:hypothetical protein H696_00274 [Fonticula alba]KCV72695.1 hypothetical protein H696_00274 [Fonticula alba]|eukprot:XP_009492396.1 hypothetical protein H696_00274 [Fonticula alba]